MSTHKERRIKWAEALESGEYAQSHSQLRDSEGFCCLGVACDVYQKETGNGEWIIEETGTAFRVQDGNYSAYPPEEVRDWYGFSSVNPELTRDGIENHASNLNDALKLTFPQIAQGVRDYQEVEQC